MPCHGRLFYFQKIDALELENFYVIRFYRVFGNIY